MISENKEPLISIIVPAYNAQNTLERCIKSVGGQTGNKFEIIIIENGSTDNTSKISEKLQNHNHFIRIYHSEKGVSAARNTGITYANGQWVTFLDADDEIVSESLHQIFQVIDNKEWKHQETVPDILICGNDHLKDQDHLNIDSNEKNEIDSYISRCMYYPTRLANNHGVIYRLEFLKLNSILFDTSLKYGEDSVFYLSSLFSANYIVTKNVLLYRVIFYENSTMRKTHNNILVHEYERSIDKLASEINKRENDCNRSELNNAFQIYVLNQLLIILVHETIRNKQQSIAEGVTEIKSISNQKPYSDAIAESDLSMIGGASKIVFEMLKKRMYFLVYCIIKMRQIRNNRKNTD
jgi:glycosyltransferase involved in cell wall biosynthesis